MSDTSKEASGFNRRKFLQGAVLSGVAALTAERLSGQGRPESSPSAKATLIRPAAPGAPEDDSQFGRHVASVDGDSADFMFGKGDNGSRDAFVRVHPSSRGAPISYQR
jgi:hypothetical protein